MPRGFVPQQSGSKPSEKPQSKTLDDEYGHDFRISLLTSAKRMGLGLSEMASIDVPTMVDLRDMWSGGKSKSSTKSNTPRAATQADIDALLG